jgi:hypothetical protein
MMNRSAFSLLAEAFALSIISLFTSACAAVALVDGQILMGIFLACIAIGLVLACMGATVRSCEIICKSRGMDLLHPDDDNS